MKGKLVSAITNYFVVMLTMPLFAMLLSCQSNASQDEMINLLDKQHAKYNRRDNYYASAAQVMYYDSMINVTTSAQDKMLLTYNKCYALIASGLEEKAIPLLEEQVAKIDEEGINGMNKLKAQLALAYLRAGERTNCIGNHTGETCIMPIQGTGIHTIPDGSRNAIRMYTNLLQAYPDNMEYRWLLNIAYMTLGEYPAGVPEAFLVPGLSAIHEASRGVRPFKDVASGLQLDVNNMAGGVIVDDFDNDGYLDIVTSSWDLDEGMHFFINQRDGSFADRSVASHLKELRGGLNIMQMDFNNDGFKDIFVLRGAWLREDFGLQPNSLIKNNGDGTFTDVTVKSGLLSFHPSQTATWNDFNNDGWVDVFIGNETWEGNASSGAHPCELYMNRRDGTFVNVAKESGSDVAAFIKGVTSADYNNDGWKDIFITSLSGRYFLLRNNGVNGNTPMFEDVTEQAKLTDISGRTFPTWFWDYNNDGWMDIFAGDFTFDRPISSYAAEEALGTFDGVSGAPVLYKNNQDGTFTNVSKEVGINKTSFAMSGNFGDIDNDGFLDFYLGTGNPELESIVPNKMFKNMNGETFIDITAAARVGHLQKGHAIAFADMDNDGDQDIYIEMGGAYKGDAFHNAFYLNPGQEGMNHWIGIDLIAEDNKSIIGTTGKLTFQENGKQRSIYFEINSGGSFGASPLRKELGVGAATIIDELSINWHHQRTQIFHNIPTDRFLRIREDIDTLETINLKMLNFETTMSSAHHH